MIPNYHLGRPIAYVAFLADPAVPLDNNISEREMKRIVLNRNYVQCWITSSPVADGAQAVIFIG